MNQLNFDKFDEKTTLKAPNGINKSKSTKFVDLDYIETI